MHTEALVIAGTSFVGRHVRSALRARGVAVAATSRRADGSEHACDVTDRDTVERLVDVHRPRWLFNCAAATANGESAERLYDVHVRGTLHVLRAVATRAPKCRVVLFGSAAEYGSVAPSTLPVREDQRERPTSLFGASKLAQTQLGVAAAAEWRLHVAVVRPFNVIGPGSPERYLAGALARRLRDDGETDAPFDVVNGEATRDFVDVRDVAEAVASLVEVGGPPCGEAVIYNVASGRETPVLSLAASLCALAGARRAVSVASGASRSGISRSAGDASRLRRETGWAPRISVEQSLEDLWRELLSGSRGT